MSEWPCEASTVRVRPARWSEYDHGAATDLFCFGQLFLPRRLEVFHELLGRLQLPLNVLSPRRFCFVGCDCLFAVFMRNHRLQARDLGGRGLVWLVEADV